MIFDLIIIGAGAAGLMAAARASELGARVLILEKRAAPGTKLLITGNGRCNLTNNSLDNRSFALKFGKKGSFLLSGLSKFSPTETIDFFSRQGLKTKVEAGGRVFPISNSSREVLDILISSIKKNGGVFNFSSAVKKIIYQGNKIKEIVTTDGKSLSAKNYIIATGGKSYPATGSTGDAYDWLRAAGHNIVEPMPSLAPLIFQDRFIKSLEGLSLKSVKLSMLAVDKKIASEDGDIIFTDNGLSGPAALNLSRHYPRNNENISVVIDFLPQRNERELNNIFSSKSNFLIKNVVAEFVPMRFALAILDLCHLEKNLTVNQIAKQDRNNLFKCLKAFSLDKPKLADFTKAMLTKGGVELREIDNRTMRSRIISNLLVAGEMLDLDGPTGGYNLQVAWTTGYLAGENSII